jgi:hypothetical protein
VVVVAGVRARQRRSHKRDFNPGSFAASLQPALCPLIEHGRGLLQSAKRRRPRPTSSSPPFRPFRRTCLLDQRHNAGTARPISARRRSAMRSSCRRTSRVSISTAGAASFASKASSLRKMAAFMPGSDCCPRSRAPATLPRSGHLWTPVLPDAPEAPEAARGGDGLTSEIRWRTIPTNPASPARARRSSPTPMSMPPSGPRRR